MTRYLAAPAAPDCPPLCCESSQWRASRAIHTLNRATFCHNLPAPDLARDSTRDRTCQSVTSQNNQWFKGYLISTGSAVADRRYYSSCCRIWQNKEASTMMPSMARQPGGICREHFQLPAKAGQGVDVAHCLVTCCGVVTATRAA